MSEPEAVCAASDCGRPSPDGSVCPACARSLAGRLGGQQGVRELADQLDITISRQHRIGGVDAGVRTPSRERPLMFHTAASDALWALHGTLLAWAGVLCRETGDEAPAPISELPRETAVMGEWIAARTEAVRRSTSGGALVDAIDAAITRGWVVVDRPPEQTYAGPCQECGADLYAERGAIAVVCDCGARYELAERRRWLRERVEDRLITAIEASRALPGLLGKDKLSVDTIRLWINGRTVGGIRTPPRVMVKAWLHEGDVVAHPVNGRSRPLCRAGDLIDLALEQDRVAARKRKAS